MNNVQPQPSGPNRDRGRLSGRRPARIAAVILLLLLILGGGFWYFRANEAPQGNLSGAALNGSFTLTDDNGNSVTSNSFDGKWRLMYFGYTFCPDVCPTDMAKLGVALKKFREEHPDAAKKLQPLFVTVDPERDTPAVLHQFTKSFDPAILGLTGSPAEVQQALKNFRIYAAKVPGETPDSYTYDHSALFYLMDPKGRPVEFMASITATPESILALLDQYLA